MMASLYAASGKMIVMLGFNLMIEALFVKHLFKGLLFDA